MRSSVRVRARVSVRVLPCSRVRVILHLCAGLCFPSALSFV